MPLMREIIKVERASSSFSPVKWYQKAEKFAVNTTSDVFKDVFDASQNYNLANLTSRVRFVNLFYKICLVNSNN